MVLMSRDAAPACIHRYAGRCLMKRFVPLLVSALLGLGSSIGTLAHTPSTPPATPAFLVAGDSVDWMHKHLAFPPFRDSFKLESGAAKPGLPDLDRARRRTRSR
jgi:hypothetical protein